MSKSEITKRNFRTSDHVITKFILIEDGENRKYEIVQIYCNDPIPKIEELNSGKEIFINGSAVSMGMTEKEMYFITNCFIDIHNSVHEFDDLVNGKKEDE